MSRTTRVILALVALGVAAVLGYGLARWMAGPMAPPAAPMKVSVQPAPEQPTPPPVVAAAPSAPAAPKPKAAAVVDQNIDAQVAEDAAAVGMTTLDPDPTPADEPAQAPSQDSEPVY